MKGWLLILCAACLVLVDANKEGEIHLPRFSSLISVPSLTSGLPVHTMSHAINRELVSNSSSNSSASFCDDVIGDEMTSLYAEGCTIFDYFSDDWGQQVMFNSEYPYAYCNSGNFTASFYSEVNQTAWEAANCTGLGAHEWLENLWDCHIYNASTGITEMCESGAWDDLVTILDSDCSNIFTYFDNLTALSWCTSDDFMEDLEHSSGRYWDNHDCDSVSKELSVFYNWYLDAVNIAEWFGYLGCSCEEGDANGVCIADTSCYCEDADEERRWLRAGSAQRKSMAARSLLFGEQADMCTCYW